MTQRMSAGSGLKLLVPLFGSSSICVFLGFLRACTLGGRPKVVASHSFSCVWLGQSECLQKAQQVGPISGGHSKTTVQSRASLWGLASSSASWLETLCRGGWGRLDEAGGLQDEGRTHCSDGDTPATSLGRGCPSTTLRFPLVPPSPGLTTTKSSAFICKSPT